MAKVHVTYTCGHVVERNFDQRNSLEKSEARRLKENNNHADNECPSCRCAKREAMIDNMTEAEAKKLLKRFIYHNKLISQLEKRSAQ